MTTERIFFLHIPKTGGTSLRSFFVDRLGAAGVSPMLRGVSLREAMAEYGEFQLVGGHISAAPGDRLPAGRISITVLRDPVDRLISEFHFLRSVHGTGTRSARDDQGDFTEWLFALDEHSVTDLNGQVNALWPLGWSDPSIPPLPERLPAAKRALDKFDIVGVQQWLDELAALLCLELGWQAPERLRHENVTPGHHSSVELPAKTRARLEAVLAPDRELFEYACTLHANKRYEALRTAARLRCASAAIGDERAATKAPTREPDAALIAAPAARDTGIHVVRATLTGEISRSSVVQTGENLDFEIVFHSRIQEENLAVGLAIRDHRGGLVFGTNTYQLGTRLSVEPGEYAVTFRFPNDLGGGQYVVDVALHRGATHLERSYDWAERACAFEVVESITDYFQGRIRLRIQFTAEALTPDAHLGMHHLRGGELSQSDSDVTNLGGSVDAKSF